MARPRKHNIGLPVGVYLKHGAYYRVINGTWVHLGKTLAEAEACAPTATARLPTNRAETLRLLLSRFAGVRRNAKTREIEFLLSRDDLAPMLAKSGWRCAVTGAKFTAEVVKGTKPFAPSIDRIDSDGPYSVENCRVVCMATNLGMNVWGAEIFRTLRRHRPKPLDVPLDER